MVRCIIVDEQPESVRKLKNYIKKTSTSELIASFSESKGALTFLKTNPVDLILLNIKKITEQEDDSVPVFQRYGLVVLTSADKKLAYYGFEQNVAGFLAKPVLYDRFKQAIEKVLSSTFAMQHPIKEKPSALLKGGYVFIKEGTRLVRLELDDIYYVMGLKNYVSIQTKSHRIICLQTMKEMENLLPPHRFIRVHRSYYVSMDKIIFVEKQQIHLKDKVIPIGQMYVSLFIKQLTSLKNH
jgi:DNA-binding LytR/AlgR family response regulator